MPGVGAASDPPERFRHGQRRLDLAADLGHEIPAQRAGRRRCGQDHRGHLAPGRGGAGRARARSGRMGAPLLPRRWPISSSCRRAGSSPAPAPAATSRCSTASSWATIPDDMAGIFSHLREAALTMQQGGGIGYDFSTPAPQGRAGEGRRRGRLGAALVHGCVGRDVPHHHERGLSPRRDDGDAALRSSRHRGLHRRQARARAACACSTSRSSSPTPSWRR